MIRPQSAAKPGGRRAICFGWYGGKFNHLGWLLPLLPVAHHYCEPFGGSAAVLLNRDPAPVEVPILASQKSGSASRKGVILR